MNKGTLLALLVGMALTATVCADDRPNILLIVADDLGYADLGVYGSDIETPNIDKLAAEGLLFTNFHASPYCAPTRAMLLSGNNNHLAGMGLQWANPLVHNRAEGYEKGLSDRVVPFSRLLRESGYHTYIVGKWHLGETSEQDPTEKGFENSWVLAHGAGTHFDARGFREGGSVYRHDGREVEWPAGAYSTEHYTDRLIEFIERNRFDGKPFFALAAYTSPHWPLQVPGEYLDKYAGRYDMGYDALREQNLESLKAANIIAADHPLPPRLESITPWEDLSDEDRRREARKMELYAAMVDNLDHHVGRLVEYLKARDLYDNTLIVFMSDNGAAAEDFYNRGNFVEYVQSIFDNAYPKMGTAESFVSYGPQWALAGAAPFNRHKGFTTEGGIVAPMIASGPGVEHSGGTSRAYVTLLDLAPTFLEVADTEYPPDAQFPLLGASLSPLLAAEAQWVHGDDYVTVMSHAGRALVRQGDWKLITLEGPFSEEAFQLFNLAEDPGETTDLSEEHPEKRDELIAIWREKRVEYGIVIPSDL